MVSTTPPTSTPQTSASIADCPLAEQRVVFRNLSWQAYEQILAAVGDSRAARFTFDRGTLEITMPSEQHESAGRLIERFIYILIEELGLNVKTMGSTTLNYPNLDRGAEPDDAYYIQNQSKVVGKIVDLTQDPPPDLIVEVDITHTDIDKLNLYASMEILEFWRYNGTELRIYQLRDQAYVEVEYSPTFPQVPKERLYEFLEESKQGQIEAGRSLRIWLRETLTK